MKGYLTRYVLKRPGGEFLQCESPELNHLVTLVSAMVLRDQEWPLADVPVRRFTYEKEQRIKPVSAVESRGCLSEDGFLETAALGL